MTVIAAFNVRGCPLLFGDLLLTGEADLGDRKVAVPALGDVSDFFDDSGWSILGMKQKIALISDHCAVAWSGWWRGAAVAISQLREMAAAGPLTTEGILAYLNREPELRQYPASFVGWLANADRFEQFWFGAADAFDGGQLGQVYVTGSNNDAVREVVQAVTMTQWQMTGEASVGDIAAATGLAFGGVLLRTEFHEGHAAPTLRTMFGGGYEVAGFFGNRFQKLGDLTFVIWEAQVIPDGVYVSHPQLIIKQKYAGDFLLLRSVRVGATGPDKLSILDEQRHVIRPMYETLTRPSQDDLSNFSLESRLLCHCILVRSGTEVAVYTRIQRRATDSEQTMTFQDEDGRIVFGFNSEFARELSQTLHQFPGHT